MTMILIYFLMKLLLSNGIVNKRWIRHCDPYMARVVPNNPIAFPPSMEVSVGYYCCMDATGRVESGTETESNAWSNYRAVFLAWH